MRTRKKQIRKRVRALTLRLEDVVHAVIPELEGPLDLLALGRQARDLAVLPGELLILIEGVLACGALGPVPVRRRGRRVDLPGLGRRCRERFDEVSLGRLKRLDIGVLGGIT